MVYDRYYEESPGDMIFDEMKWTDREYRFTKVRSQCFYQAVVMLRKLLVHYQWVATAVISILIAVRRAIAGSSKRQTAPKEPGMPLHSTFEHSSPPCTVKWPVRILPGYIFVGSCAGVSLIFH